MSRTLRLNSRLLFLCLVLATVEVSSSCLSRGRRAVHEQRSSLGTQGPRKWRTFNNPYTFSQGHSQPVPSSVQPDQAQIVFSLRPGVQTGREGSPDGEESLPSNSQSNRFSSTSVPSKTVHFRTYPSSGLVSPLVPRTWGASGTFHSVSNPMTQRSHVTTSSSQPARDTFGSPVVDDNSIPAQQAENPVSKNERSKYRSFLSSYLFRESQSTSSTSETTQKGPSEGVKTISRLGATQSEANSSVHGSGRSTHVQRGYGYIGSQLYPTATKSANGQQVHPPTLSQSGSSKVDATSEAQHASSINKPFHHSVNFAQSGGSPSSYFPGGMTDTQAKSAFSRIQPLIRFGSFWNTMAPTASQPTQHPSEPAERETAPDQSLKTRSGYVLWKKPGLSSSSSGQYGLAPGGYKPGKSTNVNTLGGFQYQDPEKTFAPTVSDDDISVAIKTSVNTNTAKSQGTGWRNSHGIPKGMIMSSVSGYPNVYRKYSFAPRIRVASTTTFSSQSDTLAPMTFKSGPREVQLASIEDDLVSNSLHASSNVQSSEVQTTTTDMSGSTTRSGKPWFLKSTPSKDKKDKIGHVFKGSQTTLLQSPQSESLKHVQPTFSLPGNNAFHDRLTAGAAKPGPTSSAPFKPVARFNMFGSVIYRLPKGSRSKQNECALGVKLPGETRPSGSNVSAPAEIQPTSITLRTASQSQNVHSKETSQSSDSFHKTVNHSSYEDPKSHPCDSDRNEMTSNPFRVISGKLSSQNSYAFMGFQKPISKAGSTQDKDADLCAQTVPPINKKHPPPVVPTSAPSVHPSPPRIQVQPGLSITEPTESRKPTSSVVKGRRMKVKHMQSQHSISPSNYTASQPAKAQTMRFKAIQFADILGSASFSGIQPRGSSRPSVQSTSNTPASGEDGGALDKDQPTPRVGVTPR